MYGRLTLGLVFILLHHCAASQDKQVFPNQFVIARHTFFDFGPPTDYYELFLVKTNGGHTSIDKFTLTPAADVCTMPATVEAASGSVPQPVAALLGRTNPCTIPEKELRRELKRCKKCLVFSGANIAMQVQCGAQLRVIRADILDRDMFDAAPDTPTQTSWTMELLGRLDNEVGPGVMEKPIFPTSSEKPFELKADPEALQDIAAGKYDSLFRGAPDKASELYRASKASLPVPTVKLLSAEPFQPETLIVPGYPPLARLAHIEGKVTFTIDIDESGNTKNFKLEYGHPLLVPALEKAVADWKFQEGTLGKQTRATVEFRSNCPPRQP